MNMCLEVGDSDFIIQRAIAPVTKEEIALMQDHDVENGDGVIDFKEFVIMAAVRIGSVSPQFMRQLRTHFKEFIVIIWGKYYTTTLLSVVSLPILWRIL
jgi:hypothetical protein